MKLAKTFAVLLTAILLTTPALAGDGVLGVYLTEDERTRSGALIEEVADGSAAARAGIRKGDRIVKCNGQPTPNASALIPHLVRGNAGDTLKLRVDRDGWQKTLRVVLARKKGTRAPTTPEAAPPAERGFLGIYLRQNDGGQPVIDGVMDDSPAAKAGLRVGDTVLAVGDRRVSDPSSMIAACGSYGVGQRVTFTVDRNGRRMNVTATLARRPAEGTPPAPEAAPVKPTKPSTASGKKPYIGVALIDDNGKGPLRVDDVQANSPAERFGLRKQDVLLQCNGKALKTIEDFVASIQGKRPGDTLVLKIERDGWKSDIRLTLGSR